MAVRATWRTAGGATVTLLTDDTWTCSGCKEENYRRWAQGDKDRVASAQDHAGKCTALAPTR